MSLGSSRPSMETPAGAAPSPQGEGDPKERARELLAKGRVEDARILYSEALRLDPKDTLAREGVAACAVAAGHEALRAGETQKAVSHYQKALEIVPFHPGADGGLRRASQEAKKRAQSTDPLLAALDRVPLVQAFREARVAERVISRATGMPRASTVVRERLEERHQALASEGALPREQRVARERASAWRRRWLFRSLPVVAVGVSAFLVVATGVLTFLVWGALFGGFAAFWDLLFVERTRTS